ncbi:SARP family transcriptional regulator [Sphaerisporangium rufum]|uniref:SARP family transcriptional regulator n=1 Tax=Sphaerisporangium rufum TaxID=1381558 RepID=A0A919R193_9ACTN|nr:XRE family transcriptional regulator [Sphaerisporangium rufum]GII77493.1 SARP family transcriptional regulator [Sphaerisporangium rufum]
MRERTAPIDPRDELAARLRLIQELSGLGVRALARDAGLSSSSLSRYLNGRTVPPWPAVVALCRLVKRDPRPLRPLWERTAAALPAPPETSRRFRPPVRDELPRDVPDFIGREERLAAVLAAIESHRAVSVDGMAGVGKTCLAVHAAHRLAADFPDGRLYVDLHGFTEGRPPLDPDSALRTLLAALDVPSDKVPQDGLERLAACWRSELARRRVLVVLDNAADAGQVRPLLPGAGPSATLITSRNRLVGLEEVPPVSLDVLSPAESAELLARAGGDPGGPDGRLARDPAATAEVLRLCGHLPLALRLAGARLRHRPGWTMGVLAERMAGGAGDTGVDPAFAMSVRQLSRAQGRLFRLLGLLPGASFDEYVVAAVAGVPVLDARAALEELVDAHLVQQPVPDRHRLHDLVHRYARRAVAEQEPAAERERALGRVLDYYVHAAAAADAAMPFPAPARPPAAGRAPDALPRFAGKHAAFAWFVAEYGNLMAAIETAAAAGADTHVHELPRYLRAYFARRCGTTHLNALFERSLAAAERLGDPARLAESYSDLGFARYNAGRPAEAAAAYDAAGALLPGDPRAEAELAMRRGQLLWDGGHAAEPLELFRLAGRLYGKAGCPAGAAHAAAAQAWTMLQLGEDAGAARLAGDVLEVPHADPGWPPALTARITLGVAIAGARPDEALAHLHRALALARDDGHLHNQAWCLNCLGVALRRMGRYQEALAKHREAFALLDELFAEEWKVHFLNGYGETCRLAGLPGEALRLHRQVLELAPALGNRHQQVRAHEGIAVVLDETDPAAAAEHRAAGLALLQELPLAG